MEKSKRGRRPPRLEVKSGGTIKPNIIKHGGFPPFSTLNRCFGAERTTPNFVLNSDYKSLRHLPLSPPDFEISHSSVKDIHTSCLLIV